jgi:hypothetical protein
VQIPPPSHWRALRALHDACGARFIINLKLYGGDLKFAALMQQRAMAELGPDAIVAFELGNEPE